MQQASSPRKTIQEQYHRTRDGALRAQLLIDHSALAVSLAMRFARKGQCIEDLRQVAFIALLKAIDGFDPSRGLQFSSYATPTILGELKRYLRDQTWAVRPPRRVHDQYLAVERAIDDLTQERGRHPTTQEVAERVGVAPEAVLEAMDAVGGRQLPSLDAPTPPGLSLSGAASNDDRDLGGVERSMAVSALLKRLRPEDERVIRMRFGLGMSQREIARALGRSQMQISRTLARSLKRLRDLAGAEALYAE